MLPENTKTYEFANFRLDCAQKRLFRDGVSVPLTPKVFDTLELLVENSARLLEKDELMQRLWPDRFVEESNLTSNIKMLRKALGDDAANPRFIETVPRRGYRFIAAVGEPRQHQISHPDLDSTVETPSVQRRYILISVTAILLISVFGIAFMWEGSGASFKKPQDRRITRLTTSGKVTNLAAASDGRSIVFSQRDNEGESLWKREIDSGNLTQIIPADNVNYVGLTISPDGKYAYYSVFSQNAAVLTLSRVPVDGGQPEGIPNVDTDVSISFSPSGDRFAYIETHSSEKETEIKIANADGSERIPLLRAYGEKRILPFYRANPVAWSPDGKTLACAIQENDENGSSYRILLVDPESGSESYLSDRTWSGIENVVWTDAENLAFIEFEPNSPLRHIWQISRTSGDAHRLTNDLNSYEWLSNAGGHLFSLQKTIFSSLHVTGIDGDATTLPPKQIFGESGLIESVAWTTAGEILYNSRSSGKNEVWKINSDGTAPRQLTSDSNLILGFSVSPVDGSLVFSSVLNGRIYLSTAAADGQGIRRLTDGPSDISPVFAPNGENVVFQRGTSPPTLWTISTNNGQPPAQLTGYQSTNPSISPDGKQIAFHFMDFGSKSPHWKLGLIDSQTHAFLNKLEFPLPVNQRESAWNPKSNLLTMAFGVGGNAGLILWSITDGKVQKIDSVDAGRIGAFAWSPDGSKLVFSQVFETSDVIELDTF
jgi:DNA-binding winged helix-turn-helix (wHTH) protein/Tol biopolymer transport system component